MTWTTTTTRTSRRQTYDKMFHALRVSGGAIGADAVLVNTSKKAQGALLSGGLLMAIDAKYIKAVAIRWSEK